MSDGFYSQRDGYVGLCTDSFTKTETFVLMHVLKTKFNLECRTETKGKGLRIIIKKSSVENLQSLVAKYIIPSMQYKIGMNLDYTY
jgi:hypothetical protein